MILTKSQATAVYDAMCALNNVGGTIGTVNLPHPEPGYRVTVGADRKLDEIYVTTWAGSWSREHEVYSGQADFSAAYGLEG